jgi:hypothetical protein
MVDTFKTKIARFLAPEIFQELEDKKRTLDDTINQRVAATLAKMDPFEPLLKEFHGIFSEEYEKPEDQLNRVSEMQLKMWAYAQRSDPSFKYMMDWMANKQGNHTLRQPYLTGETILYGRALLANVSLMKKEINRLALSWEDHLREMRGESFDSNLAVE